MNFRKIKQKLRRDIKTTENWVDILSEELPLRASVSNDIGELILIGVKDRRIEDLTRLNIELIAVKIMQTRAIRERLIDEGYFGHRINLCDQYILERGMELRNYLENNN